jgi:hypothetical protein
MKRYIYIIIGIVVVAIIAILVLLFIKNRSSVTTGTGSTATSTGSLPVTGPQGTNNSSTGTGDTGTGTTGTGSTTGTGTTGINTQAGVNSFGALSNGPVLDYFIGAQNNITAIEPSGAIVSIANGQAATINSSTINDIISARFSYDGKKILVNFGDPSMPQSSIFDLTSKTWAALPQGLQSPQWSPTNYQIAYFVNAAGGRITLATIDASNLKKAGVAITSLHAADLALQWPTKNEFILSDKPSSQNAGSIWAFNSLTGTLTVLDDQTPGAESIWSNTTTAPLGLVFYDGAQGTGSILQLESLSGTTPVQPLNFLTLPSKCIFNSERTATSTTATTSSAYLALYCGIPRTSSGFSSAQLPDDYETMALFTSDDIYKINTQTGSTQVLWSDQDQNMDVSDVKYFNNALFFVNRYDQRLYGLTFAQ